MDGVWSYILALLNHAGDFIVQRADGVFAYQLAVVANDADMGITEVVRGSDLALDSWSNYLQDINEVFLILPLTCAPDGRRLSKRNHDLNLWCP